MNKKENKIKTVTINRKNKIDLKQYEREWALTYSYDKFLEFVDLQLDKKNPMRMKTDEETHDRKKRQDFINRYEQKINIKGGIKKMSEIIKISMKADSNLSASEKFRLKNQDPGEKMDIISDYMKDKINPDSELYNKTYELMYNMMFKNNDLSSEVGISLLDQFEGNYASLKDAKINIVAGELTCMKRAGDPFNEKVTVEPDQDGDQDGKQE